MMNFDEELLTRLRAAKRLVFFTGAGASTESGVPTFRDEHNGFWIDFDTSVYATVFGFLANPQRVWQWYTERRRQLTTLQPNAGHRVMAAWQDKAQQVTVITQNIDAFHQRAGSRNVFELHGSLARNKCVASNHDYAADINDVDAQPPRCSECDSLIRPDVIWFDEELPDDIYEQALQLCLDCEVLICVGSSLEVHPAGTLPVKAALSGVYVVQINPYSTPLDKYAQCNLIGKAGEILPLLWQAVWQESIPF